MGTGDAGWYYARDDRQMGPVGADRLVEMLARGELPADALVWRQGMAEWQAARSVPELAPAVARHDPPAYQAPVAAAAAAVPVHYRSMVEARQSYQGFAIAGFVLSLFMPFLGLIFSWVALGGMKRTGNDEGRGLAVAGMVVSLVWSGLACFLITSFTGCCLIHSR
jgi:hypothetical protein